MKNNLSNIFRIQKFLNDLKYPDAYRIAREVLTYLSKPRHLSEEDIFNRLYTNEPWEYIRGEVQFCNQNFKVSPSTLIPRIETEMLVKKSIEVLKKNKDIKNIIDVGTGSGCIILSVILNMKNNFTYSFIATDISKSALSIAKKNEKNIFKKRIVKWVHTNLVKDLDSIKEDTLLIANLPYIPTAEYKKLDKSVKEFEPKIALDGGDNGLKYYSELLEQMKKKKHNIKVILIETEEKKVKETQSLFKKYYPTSKIKVFNDCFEKERFLMITV